MHVIEAFKDNYWHIADAYTDGLNSLFYILLKVDSVPLLMHHGNHRSRCFIDVIMN